MATNDDQAEARDIAGGVRDLLRGTGSRADGKWVRGLRQARESNVLFGVALHAAERRNQGLGLNSLERDLLDALGTILTDAELAAAGSEYRAAVSDLGEVAVLPKVVTDKPVAQGFTVEDLKAHLPRIRAQNAGRANCAVVDLGAVSAGAPMDSPGFEAAVGDVGFGTTVVVGPPQVEADTGPEYPAYSAKFQFESFTCRRAVGDQWGGRDEIYWTAGLRSDKHVAPAYKSLEFGAVKEGQTRAFANIDKVVFDAEAAKFVAGTVMVWEADESPSAFYRALMGFIDAWMNKPVWMEITLGIITATPGAGYAGVVMDVMDYAFRIIVDLNEAFRNDDDLSCQRTFFFDRNALVTMYNKRDFDWDFNGDGRHTLRVKYAGERPVFPTGALKYLTVDDGATFWSAPVSLGWRSASPASLVSFGGKLHCMYVRPGDRAVMWSSMANGVWAVPVRVNSWSSDFVPGLVAWRGRLYATVIALNGDVLLSTWAGSGTAWSTTIHLAGTAKSDRAASMSAKDDYIYATYYTYNWQGSYRGGQIVYSSDGQTWNQLSPWPAAHKTAHRASMTTHGDRNWFAYREHDGVNSVAEMLGIVSDYVPPPSGWNTPEGPTLATHKGKVWLVVRGHSGHIHALNTPDRNSPWVRMPNADVGAMEGEPGVASHNGRLYAMYR
ncbi:hypothetical protein [Streptomyces sp. CB02261]|uniref:hypothetical protein n=1 Tax=Streptomyces sp. CB02261 TaxID=1703940 RepID=UPI00093B567B|nr:hypothetical protein [Streptomyces sp. CB02261]OKJ52709.1 hypothetical protein AMK29_31415 [Streptomyces sp. CB02261]